MKKRKRLEDCWSWNSAKALCRQKDYAEPEPEPVPVLTDRELIERILDIQIEQALNVEYLACLKELEI